MDSETRAYHQLCWPVRIYFFGLFQALRVVSITLMAFKKCHGGCLDHDRGLLARATLPRKPATAKLPEIKLVL